MNSFVLPFYFLKKSDAIIGAQASLPAVRV